jgi:hypothetical protein
LGTSEWTLTANPWSSSYHESLEFVLSLNPWSSLQLEPLEFARLEPLEFAVKTLSTLFLGSP